MSNILRPFRRLVNWEALAAMVVIGWFGISQQVQAYTVGYWRFESGSVTNDSSLNGLTLSGSGPVSYALSGTGAGAYFLSVLPQTSMANDHAVQGPGTNNSFASNYYTVADSPVMTVTNGMTIEAFVNLAATDNNTKTIASQGGSATNGSWDFVLTGGNSSRGPRHLLFQWTNVAGTWGTGLVTLDSGLQLEVGHDYYAAFALNLSDTTSRGAIFYLKDLTAGTPLQTASMAHTLTSMYDTALAFSIGSLANGAPWLGTLDEVRWSNAQLPPDQLLINQSNTLGYWRFESGNVQSDSGPNGLTLTGSGPVSYALSGMGAGAYFPQNLRLTGAANDDAVQGPGTNNSFASNYYTVADNPAMTVTSGMTIEAFVNLAATDNNAKTIASQGGGATNGSWDLVLTGENSSRGPRHLLFQWTNVAGSWGTGLVTLDSGLQLLVGHDYYVAFALNLADTTSKGAIFYLKDLTAGTPLQTVPMTHTLTSMYDTALAFSIGSLTSGSPWLGTLDEVRWSKVQLPPEQLLIARPPIFTLSFENTLTAVATGSGAPTTVLGSPTYVPGVHGQACSFNTGQVVRYASAANLNKPQGSISAWVQAPCNGSGTSWRSYFREDGPSKSGTMIPDVNTNEIWAWIANGYGLRFDVRDPHDGYIYGAIDNWKQGEWHHVVVTWDCNRGSNMYIDGRLAGEAPKTWTPVTTYTGFYIGAQSSAGNDSWGAALDEFMIYDYELTPDDVSRDYMRYATSVIQAKIVDPFLTGSQTNTAKVAFWNPDTKNYTLSGMTYALKNPGGATLQSGTIPALTVPGRQSALSTVSLTAPVSSGTYSFVVNYTDNGVARSGTASMTAVPPTETMATSSTLTLLTTIDATVQAPLATAGTTTVVSGSLGSYREASSAQHDRFAYNFNITDLNMPHVAVIAYPDDKPRTMEIILQDLNGNSDYQAQTGICTGAEFVLSGSMQQHQITFWPRSVNQSFIFMTAEVGCPAAIQSIKIYRRDQFAAQTTTGAFTGSVPGRSVGFYNEDCVINQNFGTTADLPGFSIATDRLLDYMKSFGQNALCYPLVWYNGPLYGSMAEPFQPDLSEGRPHPDGYPAYWLKRLNARGIKFSAGLHIHQLPIIEATALTDNTRIRAGEDTSVNVMYDGSSTIGKFHGADPNFNPLDPSVMNEVKAIAGEIGDRYASEPAFTGLTFVMARVKLFTFGSIKSGYNDGNLRQFQKDTSTTIPGYSLSDPNRFTVAYNWLMANSTAKEAWVAWRCQQLHAHYKSIADTLSAKRSDLKITLDFSPSYNTFSNYANYLTTGTGAALQQMREAGFDPSLYANDPNIVVAYGVQQDMFRWGRKALNPYPSLTTDVETNRSLELAPELVSMLYPLARTEAILFETYWEDAIAATSPLTFTGYPNAHECPWRVSAFNPNAYNALDSYVAALNNYDAQRIAKGGFLISTFGIESALSNFSRAMQAMPAVGFDDVAGVADPVRVRQAVVDGKNYFYVLNLLPQPLNITINLSGTGTVYEPALEGTYSSVSQLPVTLGPYDLHTFYCATSTQQVISGTVTVPPGSQAWVNQLNTHLANLHTLAATKGLATTYATQLAMADQLWANKNYGRLYLLLQERWVVVIEQT